MRWHQKLIIRNKMKDYRAITDFSREAADGCVINGHQKQQHQGRELVCVCGLSDETRKASSHDSHILKIASVARVDVGCIWPWFNLYLAWALAHICHSRPGKEAVLSEARPDTQH